MGFGEMEGIANRGDYDLSQHIKHSGRDLRVVEQDALDKPYVPYVIEPSVGLGRAMLAFLIDAYCEEEKRVVLKLNPKLSPVKAAVFPLLANKEPLVKLARQIYFDLKKKINGMIAFDHRGNIGKRYFAQDEIGTPYCITVDFQSLEDKTVTIRERDSAKQERISIDRIESFLKEKL